MSSNLTILATADLHYNIARSRRPTERLASEICRTEADALVLAGDTAAANPDALRACLRLFDGFSGLKLLVPGNHCLWCRPDEDSLTRYEDLLPAVAVECGFVLLDHEPQILGRVGLTGSIGWYDYAFREPTLGIPLPFYEAKVAPGAADYHQQHHQLLRAHGEGLERRHLEITARWMDGQHVRLGMPDVRFAGRLAETLRRQLADLAGQVDRIVAFTHHVPFEELVPRGRPDRFAFAAAFMGSPLLGEVLAAEPKVTHAVSGHTHWETRQMIGRIQAINIGCTYTHKRLEVLRV